MNTTFNAKTLALALAALVAAPAAVGMQGWTPVHQVLYSAEFPHETAKRYRQMPVATRAMQEAGIDQELAERNPEQAAHELLTRLDLNARNSRGRTLLHQHAVGRRTLLAELLAAGADANVRDGAGNNPLHVAVQGKDNGTTRLLLEAGADANARDRNHLTPLQLAAQRQASPRERICLWAQGTLRQLLAHGSCMLPAEEFSNGFQR